MTGGRERAAARDSGASLLLAIGFVLMIGVMSAGLVGLATSSLNNRNTLAGLRNRQYAADGAIEQAIAQVRTLTNAAVASGASPCSVAGAPIFDTLTSLPMRVEWVQACGVVQAADGTVVGQHNVIFSACADVGTPCATGEVIVRAAVDFEQASGGVVTKTYVQSWSVNR